MASTCVTLPLRFRLRAGGFCNRGKRPWHGRCLIGAHMKVSHEGSGNVAEPSNPSKDISDATTGALRWGGILFTVAAGLMIWPLWQPLVLATWFAIFARPLMGKVTRITRGRHRAAAVLTLLLLLLVLVPLGLFVAAIVSAATELFETLLKSKGGKDAFQALVSGAGGYHRFGLGDFVGLTKQYGERAVGLAASIAGATVTGILGVFVFVLAAYTFLAEGRKYTPGSRTTCPSPRGTSAVTASPSPKPAVVLLSASGLPASFRVSPRRWHTWPSASHGPSFLASSPPSLRSSPRWERRLYGSRWPWVWQFQTAGATPSS